MKGHIFIGTSSTVYPSSDIHRTMTEGLSWDIDTDIIIIYH